MSHLHTKYALLIAHFFLVGILIMLFHKHQIALTMTNLLAVGILTSLAAFYRPRWAFWFFVGLLPLELISISEDVLPISLRPYQFLGFILLAVTVLNISMGRGRLSIPRFSAVDICVALIVVGGFLGAVVAIDREPSFVQATILASFSALYFLARIYIKKPTQLRMPFKFVTISTLLVMVYGALQNLLFLVGMRTNSVMPGRPNATFAEADWYGMYLVLVLAVALSFCVHLKDSRIDRRHTTYLMSLYMFTFVVFVSLIISVARSAWLGALAVVIFAFLWMGISRRFDLWKSLGALLFSTSVTALILVEITGLSRFDLGDRGVSTASGLQEITIACKSSTVCNEGACIPPAEILDVDELRSFGCEHIDLEDITGFQDDGYIIGTTQRPDPNVEIRKEILGVSWDQVKNSPFFGIGWGSIGKVLGTDESGTQLNSSNIFLQVWLGSGLLGLLGFLGVIVFTLLKVRNLYSLSVNNAQQGSYALYILLGSVAILVPNLFNAGLLMGFIWVFLGTIQIDSFRSK